MSRKSLWKIRVLEGPKTGSEFPLSAGSTLGRNKAEVNLDDPKASNLHAKLTETTSGAYVLKDLNSTNGIKFKGRKVKEVIVAAGIQVRLGQSLIEFLSRDELPTLKESEGDLAAQVLKFLSELKASHNVAQFEAIHPFPRILRLEFIKGLQVETVWHVGFGPRAFGPGSGEFPIFEEKVGGISFTIAVEGQDLVLTNHDENNVTVNGQKNKKHVLIDGDLIAVATAIIHVTSQTE